MGGFLRLTVFPIYVVAIIIVGSAEKRDDIPGGWGEMSSSTPVRPDH